MTTTSPAATSTAALSPFPAPAAAPREIARRLAEQPEVWRPRVRFTQPRFHTRIAAAPGWEAYLLTWLPGQATGLHDHGGCAGAFAVLAGSVEEDLPVRVGPAGAARSQLITRRYGAGQVRAFGPDHLHEVAVRGGHPAVTLHVYAPRLTSMTRYALVDGDLVETSRERAGEDW